MQTYTIVAIYEEDNQRYCTSVQAESPEEAESIASQEVSSPIIIAGVFLGEHYPVDEDPVMSGNPQSK